MFGDIKTKLVMFALQCRRVWLVLRKPSNEEFNSAAKVSGIGILLIGLIGFVIADLIQMLS